jgi:hypothetical protein
MLNSLIYLLSAQVDNIDISIINLSI